MEHSRCVRYRVEQKALQYLDKVVRQAGSSSKIVYLTCAYRTPMQYHTVYAATAQQHKTPVKFSCNKENMLQKLPHSATVS